ncbi:hypothetical protein DSO57_1014786 [Entomophthora muscae]|uniref:Uncharacterized protein n=1 Tax=Entomophthora muscae TaxID=34485 RepID=A0ACC2UG57_9FUNG|nr:hypothetical protein DSO57_1014786 [Entomophthora muscae]
METSQDPLGPDTETCQTLKDNSLNGHQIAVNLVPSKIQTYAEVVACLKEVTTRPPARTANDHQLMPVSSIDVKTQQLGEYFSKIRYQVGNLET